ncbi:hypothetical protein [Delftia sp. S66]|nr:hypothetical protein [Delftia sp. S66]MBK0115638.1 hypothetical protein [Delftia sp. S65]MBK0119505.1 hypothetical protein [Delftia sp. S67]MBK0130191.1 hypothetical protein [Delftia sp. S66]
MLLAAAALAALGTPALATDYATCLLDKLPGVKNAPAHAAALSLCAQQHPDKFFEVRRGSGRGLLGPKSPEQCTLDKARDTSWQPAAGMIMRACGCLYSPSAGPTDMCERYPLPAEIRAQHPAVKTDADLLKLETHYRKIYAAHPDADALFARKDFWAWVTQDKAREQALTKGSTADVVRVLREFRSSRSEIDEVMRNAPPHQPQNPFSDPNYGKDLLPR